MRKMFSITLVILMIFAMATSLYAAAPGYRKGIGAEGGEKMGSGKYIWQAHKTFRLVRYVPPNGGSVSQTLTKDSIVIWDTNSDDGMTVTTSNTSGDAAVAGIIAQACLTSDNLGNNITEDAISMKNFTWLQTYGPAQVLVLSDGGITVKTAFGCGSEEGYASNFAFTTGTVTGIAGFGYDTIENTANSATLKVEVFLRCE